MKFIAPKKKTQGIQPEKCSTLSIITNNGMSLSHLKFLEITSDWICWFGLVQYVVVGINWSVELGLYESISFLFKNKTRNISKYLNSLKLDSKIIIKTISKSILLIEHLLCVCLSRLCVCHDFHCYISLIKLKMHKNTQCTFDFNTHNYGMLGPIVFLERHRYISLIKLKMHKNTQCTFDLIHMITVCWDPLFF